jgi:hypothetical protein
MYAILLISQMLCSTYDFGTSRFLCAAEVLESDLWEQCCELGGVSSNEFAPPHEFTHAAFLRAYLASTGALTSEVGALFPQLAIAPNQMPTGIGPADPMTQLRPC